LGTVRKIGVIGAGVMGAQIAAIAAMKGFVVFVRDINDKAVEAGRKHIQEIFKELVSRGWMTTQLGDQKLLVCSPSSQWTQFTGLVGLQAISASTSLDGFKDCDLVIEAAVEKMELKQKILSEVEKILPSHAIFATNTSSLSVTTLAKSSSRPAQVNQTPHLFRFDDLLDEGLRHAFL
jgi:3-hydroxybutyryl-CoA dehydrogenase